MTLKKGFEIHTARLKLQNRIRYRGTVRFSAAC